MMMMPCAVGWKCTVMAPRMRLPAVRDILYNGIVYLQDFRVELQTPRIKIR